jgi:CheY-like chemotaxis protein
VFWFELVLPLRAGPAEAAARRTAVTGYAGRRRRILVVDDVAANRSVLTELLGTLGFEVVEAHHGQEAVEQVLMPATGHAPDLVLMDSVMPVLDGPGATRRIREQLPPGQLPIVAVSANASSADRARCLDAGANVFLPKPIERGSLLEALGAQLRLHWLTEGAALPVAEGARGSTAADTPTALS